MARRNIHHFDGKERRKVRRYYHQYRDTNKYKEEAIGEDEEYRQDYRRRNR